MTLTWNPAVVLYLLGAVVLYARAVRVLRRRGRVVPAWQQGAWYGGLTLTAVALVSPVDGLGDDLLTRDGACPGMPFPGHDPLGPTYMAT